MTRKAFLVLAVSSLCGILTAPLGAETLSAVGRFDIPFPFAVNGQTMPAGEYKVKVRASDGLVEIESEAAHYRAVFSSSYPGENAVSDQATLTFHRYGDEYFLARVALLGKCPTRRLGVSPAERETARAQLSHLQAVILRALPGGR